MKKFCSSCGNQLELSRRACSECGAANPFFVPQFSLLEDQTGELEKLRFEKKKIEKQIADKEAAQVAFEQQEQLKKNKPTDEAELRNEIVRLRAQVELYRDDTIRQLNQLRNELLQNRAPENLQTGPSAIATAQNQQPDLKSHQQHYHAPSSQKSLAVMVIILVFLFAISVGGGGFYSYMNKTNERKGTIILPATEQYKYYPAADSSDQQPSTTMAKVLARPMPPANEQFDLTVTRAMDDLIGQRLSGCDIVVHSISEISNITHPVFIERLPSGYLKYQFNVTIAHNNQTHTSSPFIYYTSGGQFVRIEATDCK